MLDLNYLIKLFILAILAYSGIMAYLSIKRRVFEDMVINLMIIMILLKVLDMLMREANSVLVYLK